MVLVALSGRARALHGGSPFGSTDPCVERSDLVVGRVRRHEQPPKLADKAGHEYAPRERHVPYRVCSTRDQLSTI
jgi:ribosomal protein S30